MRAEPVCLATFLTSRTLAHWQVSADGAVPLPRAGTVRVIAFHPEERRVASGPRSIEAAKSHVVREGLSMERVRVVNRSKQDGVIYAAPVGYLDALAGEDLPGRSGTPDETRSTSPAISAVAPGLMLVDRLLERAGQASVAPGGRPFAVLIDLCAPAEEASVTRLPRERLVIAVVMPDPALQPAVVCSVTDEPVRDVARLVLYEQKLPEDAPWVLFSAADVLAAADEVAFYPSEPEWSGIAIRHLRHAMLAASVLLAAGGAASLFETTYRIRDAEARAGQARQDIDRMQRELGALMLGRPTALAHELGMDPLSMLDRSGELWRAGARVAIEARGRVAEYTVTVPFSQPRLTFQNRPSVHSVTERARIAAVLAIEPPSGCVRSGLNATGALNEITLVVRCDHPDSALAGMLPR
ncbi:MAG: hypothetical protein ACK515_23620 [bacterium]|jgi:hypothetical protein|nr:hypothetical protein [Betaproteobacteria bacterium]